MPWPHCGGADHAVHISHVTVRRGAPLQGLVSVGGPLQATSVQPSSKAGLGQARERVQVPAPHCGGADHAVHISHVTVRLGAPLQGLVSVGGPSQRTSTHAEP